MKIIESHTAVSNIINFSAFLIGSKFSRSFKLYSISILNPLQAFLKFEFSFFYSKKSSKINAINAPTSAPINANDNPSVISISHIFIYYISDMYGHYQNVSLNIILDHFQK